MKVCLTEASKLKCRTIAFPAIGTGRLAYPLDIVASEMLWAVEEFGIQNTESTLKEVLFVLHPDDEHARKVMRFCHCLCCLSTVTGLTPYVKELLGTRQMLGHAKACMILQSNALMNTLLLIEERWPLDIACLLIEILISECLNYGFCEEHTSEDYNMPIFCQF